MEDFIFIYFGTMFHLLSIIEYRLIILFLGKNKLFLSKILCVLSRIMMNKQQWK